MKKRELFSPIPKEIFKDDNMREKVDVFLVLFVVGGLVYKFVTGCINDCLSLDDHNLMLAIFANAGIAVAFLLAYLLACWVIRLALSFIYENFFHKNSPLPDNQPATSAEPAEKGEKEKPMCFEDILTDKAQGKIPEVTEKFLASHHNGRDLACLYLVLDNNLYVKQVSRHQFYLALVASFGSLVAVKERNFQDFVKKIVDEELKDMDSVDKVKEDILKLINS